MLTEMAIADAYGAAYEFVPKNEWESHGLVNDGKTFRNHPTFAIGGGRYTDDTQMSIAIVEAMLDGELTRDDLAERFVSVFKRDPRLGYGEQFYQILQDVSTGSELLEKVTPGSTRCGGAMRSGPIGLYPDRDQVLRLAAMQASITHNSPEGILAAQAISLAVHYTAYRIGPVSELGKYLEEHLPDYAWDEQWTEWASVQGIPCVHAAITAYRFSQSMTDVLTNSVAIGGDVDSVAAMAVFLASVSDARFDFPTSLYAGMERYRYGFHYLINLDKRLRKWAIKNGAFS